jgi:hypothetical protein
VNARRSRWSVPVQLALTAASVPHGRPSKSERDQLTVSELDSILVDLARAGNRLVAWWWASRTIEGESGAYCYLCGKFIDHYAGNGRATIAARRSIDLHRAQHLSEVRQARAPKAEGG